MLRVPCASASNMAFGPILFVENHDETTTEMIDKPAA